MGNIRAAVAAVTAIANYDLLESHRLQQVSYDRSLTQLKLVGSAAIADTTIDLFIGQDYIGQYGNTKAGASQEGNLDDVQSLPDVNVYAGEQIHAIVVDPPATNAIVLTLATVP